MLHLDESLLDARHSGGAVGTGPVCRHGRGRLAGRNLGLPVGLLLQLLVLGRGVGD